MLNRVCGRFFFVAEVSGLRSTKCIAKISQLAAEARDLRY